MRPRFATASLALLVLASSATSAAAQVIVGRVIDATAGGGVARARITAAGVGHDDTRGILTDAEGRYTLALPGGAYRLQVERTGYQPTSSDAVTVGPGDTVRVDLRLSIAPRRLEGVAASTRPRRLPMQGVFTPVYPTDSLLAAERTRTEGGRGRVAILGVMPTPTACYQLAGAADRVGPLITLNVQARPTDERCPPDAIGATTYKVDLRRLPAGTYSVRVLHTFRDDAWPARVAMDSSGVTVR